jgi:hypothetical protein
MLSVATDLNNLLPSRFFADTKYLPSFLLGHGLANPFDTTYNFLGSSILVCVYKNDRKRLIAFHVDDVAMQVCVSE